MHNKQYTCILTDYLNIIVIFLNFKNKKMKKVLKIVFVVAALVLFFASCNHQVCPAYGDSEVPSQQQTEVKG